MGILGKFLNKSVSSTRMEMVTERGNGFFAWNGKLYQSDIVRSCIRPEAKAVGKLVAKHVRTDKTGIQINPEPYLRFILEEPNPYMTGQMLQEKMAVQLALNNNAFAVILRDEFGYPTEIYPVPATLAEAIYNNQGELFLKFYFANGKQSTFPYTDIIHLREDFNDNDIFGDSPVAALTALMEVVNTTDQGIVKAIKNSGVIRWLLKYASSMRPEDLKKGAEDFVSNYLSVTSSTMGVAATDSKAEAVRVEPKDYVPNALVIDRTIQRILSFFNTNEKIIQSKYDENEWLAYFESKIEPRAMQFSNEYTRKIFTRRERGFGNKIVFEASSLQYASMQTKLNLVQFVDRGMMVPNEVRELMNYAPLPGGDKPIRRLDTAVVDEIEERLYNKILARLKGGESECELT